VRLGLASALLSALILLLTAASAMAAGCDGSGWIDHCNVSNNGSQVDVGASMTVPRHENPSENSAHSSGSDRPRTDPAPGPTAPECDAPPFCRGNYEVVMPPEVTLADLASFRPATPTLTGQPQGFGVVGMPANIVAAASEQQIAGTILGWDVTVRFVPAAFVFDYGDGATARTRTGGASWEQLGQAQFTPTSTSHAYRSRGTYPVTVTVQYAPSVDFGGGWRSVPGFVSASAGGYEVQVVEVRTALVDRTCAEDPSGPGCW
jgi:hypothetical protein